MQSCPHRPPCPGCPRFGDPSLDPGALVELQRFCSEAEAPGPASKLGPVRAYRHRARLAVRGRTRAPKIGIFREGTHEVVDVPQCPIHHPAVNRVADSLRRCIAKTGTPVYSDRAHAGLVRYLQVVVERATQRAQVVVVANAEQVEPLRPLFDALVVDLGDTLHSLHFNGNPARTNVILGPIWERVMGPECVEEQIGGARIFFPPGAFGQSHLALADQAVEHIHAGVPAHQRVVEFYAGVGAIGLGLVERSREVVFNEIGPASVQGLRQGIGVMPHSLADRTTVLEGAAGETASAAREGDIVVVDPPRKGLDAELLTRLNAVQVGRLFYLSCHLPSFLRDAESLVREGGYQLIDCVAFGFLPFTSHIETLATFVPRCR